MWGVFFAKGKDWTGFILIILNLVAVVRRLLEVCPNWFACAFRAGAFPVMTFQY